MSAAPRVSVVMSAYNDADRLERSIASVLGQTYRDIELIVVNDGSTDGTRQLLERLAAQDDRLQAVHQENAGLTAALVKGCAIARGEFIARQDSDDWSDEKRIAEQVVLIESDERLGFVSCPTQYVGPQGERLMLISRAGDPVSLTHRLLHEKEGPPAHGSVLFRRSLYLQVGGYRRQFYFSQDADLWMRMAENALIGYLHEPRYTATREIASTSGSQRPEQKRFGELAHRCREARLAGTSEQPWLEQAEALRTEVRMRNKAGKGVASSAEAAAAYLLGSQLWRNGDANARVYLWQAIKARPWFLRAWVRMIQTYL